MGTADRRFEDPAELLGGAYGAGKSTLVHFVVQICRQLGFLVFYIPAGTFVPLAHLVL